MTSCPKCGDKKWWYIVHHQPGSPFPYSTMEHGETAEEATGKVLNASPGAQILAVKPGSLSVIVRREKGGEEMTINDLDGMSKEWWQEKCAAEGFTLTHYRRVCEEHG